MASNTSSRSINVTWNKIRPHTVVGGGILGYRLVYTDVKGTAWNLLVTGEENTQAELKHLEIYALYCVRIMGYNRRGDGKASLPVCTYTDKDGKSGREIVKLFKNLQGLVFQVIYQAQERKCFIAFPNTEKRRAAERGVWKCDETLSRLFDISSQSRLKLRNKRINKIVKLKYVPVIISFVLA